MVEESPQAQERGDIRKFETGEIHHEIYCHNLATGYDSLGLPLPRWPRKRIVHSTSLEHGKRSSPTQAVLYRFDSNGKVTVLSASGDGEPQQTATAKYAGGKELETRNRSRLPLPAKTDIRSVRKTMKVVSYDDSSITCAIPGVGTTRWTRVDPNRYFIVLAAREEFYDLVARRFRLSSWLEELPQSTPSASIRRTGREPLAPFLPPYTRTIFERHATTRKPHCVWKSTPGSMKGR